MLLKANVIGYFITTPETKQIWKRETHLLGIWTHYKSPIGITMRVLHTKGLPCCICSFSVCTECIGLLRQVLPYPMLSIFRILHI